MRRILFFGMLAVVAFGMFAPPTAQAQYTYKNLGIVTAGDLWETFAPPSIVNSYHEILDVPNTSWSLFRMGNMDRAWTTPTRMYPAGMYMHMPWEQSLHLVVYEPTEINNFTTNTDPRAKNYVYAFTASKLPGFNRQASNNTDNAWGAAPWVDPARRSTQLYTASYPTNVGINVNVRARGFSINVANMNDFLVLELELTNTGVFDANGDGVPEATNHKIPCFTIGDRTEVIGAMLNNTSGTRYGPGFTAGRQSGYDATPDETGSPWNIPLEFRANIAESAIDATGWAPDGARAIGQPTALKYLFDVWDGAQFIAVKQGPMDGGFAAPDKMTIYDSPPIGTGAQRGWFTSVGRQWGNEDYFAYEDFVAFCGTYFEQGSRDWDRTKISPIKPDPNWFDTTQPYEAGNPLSFVNIVKPAGQRGQPKGDMKTLNKWSQNWERNFPGTPDPKIPDKDTWKAGYSKQHNFDGDAVVGVGPFSLDVGETITVVLVEYAGHRLQGVRQSVKAARWAYENNWNVPEPPPKPKMDVQRVSVGKDYKIAVKWDNKAESDAQFAGYKIYRSSAYPKVDMTKFGLQLMSHYQEQTDPNMTLDQVAAQLGEPNNPNISTTWETFDPGPWGPWKLIANVSKSALGSYSNPDADNATYQYAFKDVSIDIKFGYTYWYYVAAYNNSSGNIAGVNYTSLESYRNNWNGASGQWTGTYYYAVGSPWFPTTAQGKKDIGANFVLQVPRATRDELLAGTKKIQVKPNPYVVQAPHDVLLEHKVVFYNLPQQTKITIFDLSGQIIQVIEYQGADPLVGSTFWDMFSKDGVEVASGLYIWVADYQFGRQQGYLAIMR